MREIKRSESRRSKIKEKKQRVRAKGVEAWGGSKSRAKNER